MKALRRSIGQSLVFKPNKLLPALACVAVVVVVVKRMTITDVGFVTFLGLLVVLVIVDFLRKAYQRGSHN